MKRLFPATVFLSVAAASVFMAGYAYVAAGDAARIKFESAADDAVNRIDARIELHTALLRSTLALFRTAQGNVSREALRTFVAALDIEKTYSGIRGIGYARLLRQGDELLAQNDLQREYAIDRPVWPASSGDWRAPVVLLEPLDPQNDAALGYDMFSEPVRRAAMSEAMQSGAPRASGLVKLVRSETADAPVGFLIYLPLSLEPDLESAAGRATAPAGFVYAAFRAADLFTAALVRKPLLPLSVEVYDGAPGPDSLLFRSSTEPRSQFGTPLRTTREMTVAGRKWVLEFRPTVAFVSPMSTTAALALGLFGLLLAGALALLVRSGEKAYAAINALHAASERNLQDKDMMLQEMKHRIKNSIARILAISRQTAAGATTIEEFSASFGARLQAMSASQDMLTRSRWQKADLRSLLETELAQVFGQQMNGSELQGPDIEIDERTTQALGLTFHELATNALKYGAGGDESQSVVVSWSVQRGKSPTLRLLWCERGAGKVEPPARKGFGTRLIDANIVTELGGTIERRYLADGIDIEISIPLHS